MTTLDTHALALLNAEDMAAFQADHDYVMNTSMTGSRSTSTTGWS